MRYAFVSVSIVAIWFAMILIAIGTKANVNMLATLATGLTLFLFLVGFRKN